MKTCGLARDSHSIVCTFTVRQEVLEFLWDTDSLLWWAEHRIRIPKTGKLERKQAQPSGNTDTDSYYLYDICRQRGNTVRYPFGSNKNTASQNTDSATSDV